MADEFIDLTEECDLVQPAQPGKLSVLLSLILRIYLMNIAFQEQTKEFHKEVTAQQEVVLRSSPHAPRQTKN